MKRPILIVVAALAVQVAMSQGGRAWAQQPQGAWHTGSIERVRMSLAWPDSLSGARMEVTQMPDATAALSALEWAGGGISEEEGIKPVREKQRRTLYCVSLYSGNAQNAREEARTVAARFSGMFPDIDVVVKYENPYFVVTAGGYIDQTDAIALRGKATPHFPNAVVRIITQMIE